ncbi:MAG: putative dsRNA-binding protein [Methanoregula sp.]
MDEPDRAALQKTISDPVVPVSQKIREFIGQYNRAAGTSAASWQVSKEAWQRYEFLGDRILNLAAAELLFCGSPAGNEGEMTQKMGVVANESLAAIAEHKQVEVSLLIPAAIGQQQVYGDAVKGGAIEACIGAISVCAGYKAARVVARDFLSGEIERYDPSANFIGRLQEYFQQQGLPLPVYEEISRTGPSHQPVFTFRVCSGKDLTCLGKGTGCSTTEARQAAAKRAMETLTHP